jgi:hypothetical protein
VQRLFGDFDRGFETGCPVNQADGNNQGGRMPENRLPHCGLPEEDEVEGNGLVSLGF